MNNIKTKPIVDYTKLLYEIYNKNRKNYTFIS